MKYLWPIGVAIASIGILIAMGILLIAAWQTLPWYWAITATLICSGLALVLMALVEDVI